MRRLITRTILVGWALLVVGCQPKSNQDGVHSSATPTLAAATVDPIGRGKYLAVISIPAVSNEVPQAVIPEPPPAAEESH